MPGNINVGDVMEVRSFCYGQNQLGINIGFFRVTSVTGVPTLAGVAPGISTQLSAIYIPAISNQVSYWGVGVRLAGAGGPAIAYDGTARGAGTQTSDLLPTVVAGIVTKRTGLAGRANRGRIYVPFPVEDFNDVDGLPTVGYMALLDAIGLWWTTAHLWATGAGDTVNTIPVIYHRKLHSTTDIADHLTRQKWAQVHKRGDYGRANVAPF